MTWKPRRLSSSERAAAMQPQPMTPEQIADLVARTRAADAAQLEATRVRLARTSFRPGVANYKRRRAASAAARKASLEAKRFEAQRAAAELEARKRYEGLMRGARR